jgi:cyclomaltodextrinase
MPEWTEHVIWWHVYPLGFVGADTTGADTTGADDASHHRLAHIESWLDYLVELGANGLALGPVFESRTHGYDTTDYFRVDPRLGDTADLEHLVAEAHARGIRVLLDGVFNHVGRDFEPLRIAEAAREVARPAVLAAEDALFRRDGDGRLATFEGHDALVALDHGNPEVADLVASVMEFWLDRGVDAWRLDAAYTIPVSFWATVLPRVRSRHPDVLVVGEVLHGDYSAFVTEGTLDTVTQYELWQAVWHATNEVNFFELDWALQRHNEFLATFVPYTFVGNHDVTRIASQIDDERHRAHAMVLLFTLGGMPAVYYGDERGLRAVKEDRAGGDDAVRPAYPSDPSELETGDAAGHDAGAATFALHQLLIGLRRRHPWLVHATTSKLELTNATYVYAVSDGTQRMVVALNVGDDELPVPADESSRTAVLAGEAVPRDGGHVVPAHGWAVLG